MNNAAKEKKAFKEIEERFDPIEEENPTGLDHLEGEIAKVEPKAPSIRGNLKLINELVKTVFLLKEQIEIAHERLDILRERINTTPDPSDERTDNIEKCIAKMAHYNGGNGSRICKEFGIEVYEVKLKDMSRFS